MKWLKKWGYLLMMFLVGILYFSYVDEWSVYAKVVSPLIGWFGEQTDNGGEPGDVNISGDIVGENNIGEGSVSGNNAEENNAENKAEENNTQESNTRENNANMEASVSAGDAGTVQGSGHIDIGGPLYGVETGDEEPEANGPVYQTVEDVYFADAVFIGDSRTVGMFEYGGLEEITTFYASEGLSVYSVFDKKIVTVPGQKKKITVEEALQQNSFSKIYLMLGLNEMGTGTTETFLVKYKEVLDHLQELQPDAIIYVQAIMKLTEKRSGKGDQFHNPGIEERNAGLAEFADNEKIFFLDVNPLICDESGGMIGEYTYDGIHLKAKYIEIWKEYLKEHAILP